MIKYDIQLTNGLDIVENSLCIVLLFISLNLSAASSFYRHIPGTLMFIFSNIYLVVIRWLSNSSLKLRLFLRLLLVLLSTLLFSLLRCFMTKFRSGARVWGMFRVNPGMVFLSYFLLKPDVIVVANTYSPLMITAGRFCSCACC